MVLRWPIGTDLECKNADGRIPGDWYIALHYGISYKIYGSQNLSYHTGLDLNRPDNADFHDPIYAIDDGTITYSGNLGGSWGQLIILQFSLLIDGIHKQYYARYAHIENPKVTKGQSVKRGQIIGQVGNANNYYPESVAHLHFDISPTSILLTNPGNWPGANLAYLKLHYVDPNSFLEKEAKMADIVTNPDTLTELSNNLNSIPSQDVIVVLPQIVKEDNSRATAYKISADDLMAIEKIVIPPTPIPPTPTKTGTVNGVVNVRANPSLTAQVYGQFTVGQIISVFDIPKTADGYIWYQVSAGQFSQGWLIANRITFQ